jgi:serine/threonine-protein kinase Chk1
MSRFAAALAACHARGVVHRDLKLENVMLCAEDPKGIRLIDFGLAVQLKVDEATGKIAEGQVLNDSAGTQAYRAPEVTTEGYEPAKVDIWAMGIVLFSLVAGFFPMQEAREEDWRFKRVAAEQKKGLSPCDAIFSMYKRRCPFSPELRSLLDGMLTIDPQKRFDVAEVASHPWIVSGPVALIHDGHLYRTVGGYRGSTSPTDRESEEPPEDAPRIVRQRVKPLSG